MLRLVMFLTRILLIAGVCISYEWNTSILQIPPWGVDNCDIYDNVKCSEEEPNSCSTCSSLDNCTINVVVILPQDKFYFVNKEEAKATITDAVNQIKNQTTDMKINYDISLFDDQCKQEYATIRIISAAQKCAHVILGPVCEYCLASVGRVAKYMGNYGTPVLSPGGNTFAFSVQKRNCLDEFYMTINTGPTDYRSYGEFLHLIFYRYSWRKVALMYESNEQNEVGGENTCKFVMTSVIEELKSIENLDYRDGDMLLFGNMNYSEFLKTKIGNTYAIILTCTSHKKLRDFAIEAYKLNMAGTGEYTIFNFQTYSNATNPLKPWLDETDSTERNDMARKAFQSIFTFTPFDEANIGKVQDKSRKAGSIYLDGLYDGMLLFAEALKKSINTSLNNEGNISLQGYDIVKNMMGTKFAGKNEDVVINCNGQRITRYAMLQLNASDQYAVVAEYSNLNKTILSWDVKWQNGKDPLDTPICGYDMSLCPKFDMVKTLLITLSLALFGTFLVVGFILYRHFKLKAAIYSMAWKVNHDDVLLLPMKRSNSCQSATSFRRGSQLRGADCLKYCKQCHNRIIRMVRSSYIIKVVLCKKEFALKILTLLSNNYGLIYFLNTLYATCSGTYIEQDKLYTTVGFYKAIRVALKYLQDAKIELNREQLIELKVMKDLSHDNLVKFYGACIDIPNCILSEYCPKGSLQDILENENVQLDSTFKMSLIMDVVRGMNYLHHSDIKSHGALKSTNCLVDSRFVLKITDFGLHFLRKFSNEIDNDIESHCFWERQLWTAPELLRMENPPMEGTQKGDIYSFAMIMHEIIVRQGVFHLDEFKTAREKVDAVRKGPDANGGQPLRPSLGEALCEEEVAQIMKKCWSEDAADRPDFSTLKTRLKHINKETDGNLLDNLLARMEQYANNLESLVEERTADYLEEKRRCEELLYQLLPKSVAQQLISGESVIAETFEYVTIHFSDIVGFTPLCEVSEPLQVVEFLNDLYTCFDSIIENFDVYKVETIGDSYMVVSGLPVRNGNKHAREIAQMSLALLKAVETFKIKHRPEKRLELRVGIHTGPCVAGVVGLKMPRYCLFGDTVNTASRMESNGEPLRIHISSQTKEFLDLFGTFKIERRGEIELKGKTGKIVTYWLNGECEKENTIQSPLHQPKLSKLPSTPIPNSVRKQMANHGKALNETNYQDHQIDEADVPLLSITSPPEYNSNA